MRLPSRHWRPLEKRPSLWQDTFKNPVSGGEMEQINTPSSALAQALSACSLFYGLTEEELTEVAARMRVFEAPSGRLLIQEGDDSADTFFLIKGTAMGQRISDKGKEVLFIDIRPGGYFGELAALDGEVRSITISAKTKCLVGVVGDTVFLDLLHEYPQIAVNLATDLALRLRHMNRRLMGLIVHDVEARVRMHIMQMAQAAEQLKVGGVITEAPTHEVMASYVGANREAVSRVMAKLTKSGVLATARGRIEILDLIALGKGLD